jgi:diguanylate cyclase (GGDEF)-like protein/PAS domain S-box-containing protein
MIVQKIAAAPFANVRELATLKTRVLTGLDADAVSLIRGGAVSIGSSRELLTALPVAIYTTDAEGRITFFNEAAATLWGQRPLLGTDRYCGSWRIMSADGSPIAHDQLPLAIALRTGKDVPGAERITMRPDGSRVTIEPFPTLFRDAAGKVTGAINMLVDVTAAKATEAELRESEAHVRTTNALNPQMPWTADPQGRVLEFGERWCSFIGKTHTEALRSNWHSVVNPEDLERMRAAMREALTSEEPYDVRYRVRAASGEQRWVRSRAHPRRDSEGAIIRWYGTTEDIHEAVLVEEEARAANMRYRLASEAADDVAWDLDTASGVVTWSAPLQRRFGLWPDPAESNRAWWMGQIHPDDRARVARTIATTMAGSSTQLRAEYRFRRADGSYAHVLDRGSLIRDKDGKVVRAIGAMLDLSERKKADEALRLSEERFRLAANVAGLGIADIDMVTQQTHWSAELRAILGVTDAAPAGDETYAALIHPDDLEMATKRHRRTLRGEFGEGHKGVHRILRPSDGALRWLSTARHAMRDDEGAILRIIVTIKDITEEKTAQDRINWAATHDAVTGLPNRTAFQARLESALVRAREHGEPAGLLLIDLDNFKNINDTLGHQAGDSALAAFAVQLGQAMPADAVVVRFGGDEFAVILPGADAKAAAAVALNLVGKLQQPISIGERNIDLRASIGISAFPADGENGSDLVQNADLALYAAKAGGRATVRTFEPSLRADLQHQLSMLSQARAALAHGWIRPYYQPKIALGTGRVAGFEALLRWRDPETGLKLPATIACAFDDTELAGLIGEAMIHAVLADIRGWIDAGIAFVQVAINASAAEFRAPGFAERLLARMAAFDVAPSMLELEITETALLGDCAANVLTALETLRAAGMSIALDDFGTGYSSLSHLRTFPVDTIKIDRSFVAGLGDSAEDRAIIEAVLRLGEALGMTTVAEGVETLAQAEYLTAHGCTLAQGFLFAPAIDTAEVPSAAAADHWILARRPRNPA